VEPDWTRIVRWLGALAALILAVAIGLRAAQLSEEAYLGMSERGDEIALVIPGGPADIAGLQPGDILRSIDDVPVRRIPNPRHALRSSGWNKGVAVMVLRNGAPIRTLLVPRRMPPSEVMWGLAHAAIALATLLVGTLTLLRKVRVQTAVFFGICLTLASQMFTPYTIPTTWGYRVDALLREILSALVPGLLVHFFLLFPYKRHILHRRPWLNLALYAPGLLLFLMSTAKQSLASVLGLGQAVLGMGILAAGAAYFVISIIISILLFSHAYRKSPLPTVRHKLKVTLAGTLIGLGPILLVALIRLAMPTMQFPADRAATLLIFFLPASFGYAILKHGIFEIEFLVKRSLLYSGITAVLILTYFLAYFILDSVLHTVTGVSERIGSVLAVLFVLVVMSPVRGRLQRRIDRWIYPDRYDTQRILREAGLRLREAEGRDAVEASLLHLLRSHLGAERVALFRPGSEGEGFILSSVQATESPSESDPPGGNRLREPPDLQVGRLLVDTLFRIGSPVLREDLEAELPYGFLPARDLEALRLLHVRVIMPLASGNQRLAIVALGPRSFGESYAPPDLELLEGLKAQALSALQNLQYEEATRGREDMQREMEMARSIQQRLLPRELPKHAGLDMAAVNLPSREIGGDYYDWLGNGSSRLTFAIGDVSGKGIPAALMMSNVQATFRAEAAAGRRPSEILQGVNRHLCAMNRPESFVSLFCGQMDLSTHSLTYANAGHLHPILIMEDGHARRLEAGGLLLGVSDSTLYDGAETALRPGETLLLFTDGVVERGAPDPIFTEDDLMTYALKHRHISAQDLVGRILDELERRTGTFAEDDTTMLILRTL